MLIVLVTEKNGQVEQWNSKVYKTWKGLESNNICLQPVAGFSAADSPVRQYEVDRVTWKYHVYGVDVSGFASTTIAEAITAKVATTDSLKA